VLLLSGGLDSTTLLALATRDGWDVNCLTVRYGQRHELEVTAAARVAARWGANRHVMQEIDLRAFGGSALTGDIAVPRGRDTSAMSAGIPVTYVPARNTVFLSLALAWAEALGASDIFIGVNSIQSPRGMLPRLFMQLLEMDHKVVTGYGSSGDMRAAMQRGELNMTNDSQSGYFAAVLPMVEQGVIVPIAQEGTIVDGKIVRDPRLPDLPTYTEVLLKLKGDAIKQTTEFRAIELLLLMGGIRRGWVYAPGVPKDVFDTMATALDRFLKDPAMLAHFKKAIGFDLEALNASQAQTIADSVVKIMQKDPQAVALLKKLAAGS